MISDYVIGPSAGWRAKATGAVHFFKKKNLDMKYYINNIKKLPFLCCLLEKSLEVKRRCSHRLFSDIMRP